MDAFSGRKGRRVGKGSMKAAEGCKATVPKIPDKFVRLNLILCSSGAHETVSSAARLVIPGSEVE